MNIDVYFNGFFTCKNPQTYIRGGQRIHKPPFGEFIWSQTAHLLFAEFIDSATGKATDLFFGACNDFDIWFAAKAARGERFDVVLHEYDSTAAEQRYDKVGKKICCINSDYGTITQNEAGTWERVEFEPLREINGEYFLRNSNFAIALRENGRQAEEAEIIARSLSAGMVRG